MKKNEEIQVARELVETSLRRSDQLSQRYIEAEKFILEISQMPWWKLWTIRKKCARFLLSRLEKYKF